MCVEVFGERCVLCIQGGDVDVKVCGTRRTRAWEIEASGAVLAMSFVVDESYSHQL